MKKLPRIFLCMALSFPALPFIPQNTMLFVSTRYLQIEVGVDNNETKNDGLLRWVQLGEAGRPKLQESITANFNSDKVNVKGDRQVYGPRNLLLSPDVKAEFKQTKVLPPPPLPVITEEVKKELRYEVPFIFGNMEFPENVDFTFQRVTKAAGVNQFEMSWNFLVETAEYVTTNLTQYAQAVLGEPIKLQKVGLALHRLNHLPFPLTRETTFTIVAPPEGTFNIRKK